MNIIEIIRNKPILSYLMVPMYYVEGLLESQLLNLSYQTNQNFEVIIVDPHYNKREKSLQKLFGYLKYNIVYSRYYPHPTIPKQYDYSLWNNCVLLSNTDSVTLFQDFRYSHPELTSFFIINKEKYLKIEWQVCNGVETNIKNGNNFIDINKKDIQDMCLCGIYPESINIEKKSTILNNWGHYIINKDLWIELNGIDEHITSLHHYADLDLNARMTNYYDLNEIDKTATTIKNAMIRVAHNRNLSSSKLTTKFRNGFSTEQFDNITKQPCKECSNLHLYGDINYFDYVIELVNSGKYTLIDRKPLCEKFKETNNDKLDKKNDFVVVQCNTCYTTSESQFWWIRTKNKKFKASIGIGCGKNKLGRNLSRINEDIQNISAKEKIEILKDSWTKEYYLNEEI